MKFLNQLVCVISFFAVASVSALKTGGATPQPERVSTPAPTRTPGVPAPGPKQTLKQLHDRVLAMKQSDIFDAKNQFKPVFISIVSTGVTGAEIKKEGYTYLLQTARDKFAPFTGDNTKDLALLNNINQQISTIVEE